jgi:hypothetical protein
MKRLLIAATSSSMLLLATPGLASAAHKSRCHHHAHHACANSKHARHARLLTFGGPSTVTSPSAGVAPTTAPSTPAETPETAGTVTSFTAGVLTITLKDGSSVSGKVTEASELRCTSATPAPAGGDDPGDEPGSGSGGDGGVHGEPGSGSHGDDMSGGASDDEEGAEAPPSACTTASLVPGAVVAEAELRIGAAGAVWERVSLIA